MKKALIISYCALVAVVLLTPPAGNSEPQHRIVIRTIDGDRHIIIRNGEFAGIRGGWFGNRNNWALRDRLFRVNPPRLYGLERLEGLNDLRGLQRLDRLDRLNDLRLNRMERLNDLRLNRLDRLNELRQERLDRLNDLRLQRLDRLNDLRLDRLDRLNRLNRLNRLGRIWRDDEF